MNEETNVDFITRKDIVFPLVTLAIAFTLLLVLSYLSEGSYGGADSFVHYRIARYAPQHPELFMDNWGKPLFTLFSSPFAQFGFFGIKFFNILATVCSGYICFLIAKKLELKFAASAILLLCFAPMYFMLSLTGLTETFFSFVILFSVYLFLKERYFLCAFLISLSPFARQEGCLFMIFFLAAFLFKKKYFPIPFLLSGFFLYGIASFLMFGNFFWIISNVPYTGKADYYGSGELLHFIKNFPEITGYPLAILMIVGLAGLLWEFLQRKKSQTLFLTEKIILIVLPMCAYIAVHSILWWKGLSGSLGLTRVMVTILPLAAITGASGFNWITHKISDPKFRKILFTLLIITSVVSPFYAFKFPVKLDEPQKQMKECADWLKAEHHDSVLIYYYDPFLVYLLNKNPFDINQVRERVPHPSNPSSEVGSGSILVWDSHFGPNEGQLPLQTLQSDSNFIQLKEFAPSFEMKTLGGYDYVIVVMKRK